MAFCKIVITDSSQIFSHSSQDFLSYSIPDSLDSKIKLGSFVSVPLRKKKSLGLVIDIYKELSQKEKEFQIKAVDSLILDDIVLPFELIELFKFVADYYACSYSEVFSSLIPKNIFRKPSLFVKFSTQANLLNSHPILEALIKSRNQQLSFNRLQVLLKLNKAELMQDLKSLQKEGFIDFVYLSSSKFPKTQNPIDRFGKSVSEPKPQLSSEQEYCINEIRSRVQINPGSKFLLHGVTASGKTEVYLNIIDDVLKSGKSVIFLVPEIALAPQLVDKISSRFGADKVLIWHSAITQSEKAFSFYELQNSDPKIIVGARSAVFAPVANLGLIIIDEEHENSYKQDQPAPRYHARLVAEKRSELNNCPLILGSATPSIETYYNAVESSRYKLLTMKNKVLMQAKPEVLIIDMREEFKNANRSVFSRSLKSAIEEALGRQEQVILFLNKRGSASQVFCRSCGHVYKCVRCDSKMVYHSESQKMICHYCAYEEKHPSSCPACDSTAIKFFGLGTQKLEQETKRFFPEARVSRLDSDVSRVQNNYLELWQKFKSQEIDILIGTQMIAKGLDFPNLTVVGVVAADGNFSQLDYSTDERGFQLLTQVAGRTGRSEKPGIVVFQTYNPEKQALIDAKNQDYDDFYKSEIALRRDLIYPPFANMIRFLGSSIDEDLLSASFDDFYFQLKQIVDDNYIIGPSPALVSKIQNKFRYHLILKIPKDELSLSRINAIKDLYMNYRFPISVSCSIDLDSNSLL